MPVTQTAPLRLVRILFLAALLVHSGATLVLADEKWYENPKEYLTITPETVSRQIEDSAIWDSQIVRCDIDMHVVYPVVTAGPSQTVVNHLNGFFIDFAMEHFDLPSGATIEERANAQVDSLYHYWKAGSSSGLVVIHQAAIVEYCDNRILSLKYVDNTCISCNGHPYHEHYFHFTLPDLSEISVEGLFADNSRAYLDSIGELAFRRDRSIPQGIPLIDSGYFEWEEGKFSLNSNFVISDSGVTYVFNAYEIASGAYGMSFAHLTWDQLLPVIRPDGPIGWVLRQN